MIVLKDRKQFNYNAESMVWVSFLLHAYACLVQGYYPANFPQPKTRLLKKIRNLIQTLLKHIVDTMLPATICTLGR